MSVRMEKGYLELNTVNLLPGVQRVGLQTPEKYPKYHLLQQPFIIEKTVKDNPNRMNC